MMSLVLVTALLGCNKEDKEVTPKKVVLYDTTRVINNYYDTVRTVVFDTVRNFATDTLKIFKYDTIRTTTSDTVYIVKYDTTHNYITDTINLSNLDTIHLPYYETLSVAIYDTIHITIKPEDLPVSNFWVKYVVDQSANIADSVSVDIGETITLPSAPEREDHTFRFWDTKSDGFGTHYNPGDEYTVNTNTTFYAKWHGDTLLVQYRNVDGLYWCYPDFLSLDNPSCYRRYTTKCEYGDTIIIGTHKRAGYELLYYNTQPDGSGIRYYPNDELAVTDNVTLYGIYRNKKIISSDAIDQYLTYLEKEGQEIVDYTITGQVSGQNDYGCAAKISKHNFLKHNITIAESSTIYLHCSNIISINILQGSITSGKIGKINCPNLESITISKDVEIKEIGENAFSDCTTLTSLELPEGIETIGEYAFSKCTGLTSLELPNGVKSIAQNAFAYDTNLKLTIPKTCTRIGGTSMNVKTLILKCEEPPEINNTWKFEGTEILVPKTAISKYYNATGWITNRSKIKGYE